MHPADAVPRVRPDDRAPAEPGRTTVEIVVPVHNEARGLGLAIRRVHAYLTDQLPFPARITIAENGSTDATWMRARELEDEFPMVRAVQIGQPGRGGALRSAWSASDADVLAYMDVDLSTDLNALLPLIAPLVSGHSDVAIGTRLAWGARVVRGPRREIISRCYNLLLYATLGTRFSDAQCGFKAIRAEAARALMPLTADRGWFFDTELLVLAQRAGLRIHEVPVDWIDDRDSRVKVIATALADLHGIARLGTGLSRGTIRVPALGNAAPPGWPAGPDRPRHRLPGQLARFISVGVTSTVAYVLLYLLLRSVMAAWLANAISLLVTAIGNTAANRRVTFGIRGRHGAVQHQARGLVAFGSGLALTSGALAALQAVTAQPAQVTEVTVLVAANLGATLVRFGLYRGWVCHGWRDRPPARSGVAPAQVPIQETAPVQSAPRWDSDPR